MITYEFLQQYWWFLISLLGGLLVFLLFVQGGNVLIFSAGKTEEEIRNTFNNGKCLNSEKPCSVVDYVRFYIPDIDRIVPCNCISHRLNQLPFNLDGDTESCCEKIRKWLKENSKDCTGCEPLNIFINDNPEIMEEDNIRY